MRTFAQKQDQPREQVSSSFARSNTAILGTNHHANLLLHLQHTIGNQAVQQMRQTHSEELEVGSTSTAASRFAHDFSRIPLHSKSPVGIQAKLTINTLSDIYEEEADAVAEQVMRMTTAPASNVQQPIEAKSPVRRKTIGDGQVQTAPSVVHEVLRSSGQPLDAATRAFMEPRFGYDFSNLRVHTDAKATESAQAIGAAAYTVGNDLVFGAGEFNPQNSEGRRLIAHELTHVVQQSKGSCNVQQQPKKGRVVRVERPSRSKPKPPGPGVYTYEELCKWYDTHPNKKTESVHLVNGKRTQDEAYTLEALWVRGYVYAITNVHGNLGTEVWLNDDGDGKVIGIDREIP